MTKLATAAYVLTGPALLASFFTIAAACGQLTSDPQGLHPVTVAQLWSLR